MALLALRSWPCHTPLRCHVAQLLAPAKIPGATFKASAQPQRPEALHRFAGRDDRHRLGDVPLQRQHQPLEILAASLCIPLRNCVQLLLHLPRGLARTQAAPFPELLRVGAIPRTPAQNTHVRQGSKLELQDVHLLPKCQEPPGVAGSVSAAWRPPSQCSTTCDFAQRRILVVSFRQSYRP